MIVDTNVYVLSLIKVFICFLIRDFLIPQLVWQKHLKSRSFGYRFWFCVITQAALQINLVLLFGFFNICNRWTILGSNVLIYSLIAWNYSDKRMIHGGKKLIDDLWQAYKEENLRKYLFSELKHRWKDFRKKLHGSRIWICLYKNWLEVILLGSLLVYNIWFLTQNVMQYHCYQFSDIPAHQSWIYNLEQGTIFSNGIYPFGMHAMIYFVRAIFRLNLREILLYAGAYQTILLMVGVYLLAKEIFHAKYTPVTVVLIISLMLNQSRYAASLPQEAGMYAVVGLAYFMIRYLHVSRNKMVIAQDSILRRIFRINAYTNRRYISSEAILLMLCVTLVIEYHYYTAIAAVILVIAIGLAYIPRILKKQYFIPLLFCGIIGALIAVIPTAAFLAKGVPFEGSINWATAVIAGADITSSGADYKSKLEDNESEDNTGDNQNNSEAPEAGGDETQGVAAEQEVQQEETAKNRVKINYAQMTPEEIIKYYTDSVYQFASNNMFGSDATRIMFGSMIAGFLCAILLSFSKKSRVYGSDYIAMIINMIVWGTVGAAKELGIVELIQAGRASTFAAPFIGFIYMLPVDFVFRLFGFWKNRYHQAFLKVLSATAYGAAAYLTIAMGWYHQPFTVYQSYYNEPEYLLRNIKQSYAKHSYTVVSTTDELYDVIDYGYHTQLSEFMNMVNGKQAVFTFPTEYVFFFIEKRVLLDHYFGPVEVDPQYAAMEFVYFADNQDYFYQRAVLESQAYYWAQKIRQIYPDKFTVYFEDDIYVAYILEQNTYRPYNLRVDYLEE